MADSVEVFKEQYPSLDSYWRSIILFGQNVATYKFALAKSLIELASTGKTIITLEDLAEPYSKNLCQHLKKAPRQVTSKNSPFINSLKEYNEGKITHKEVVDATVSKGFNNVIDAFHIVNRSPIPVQFYQKDYGPNGKRIILTDDIYKLMETPSSENFNSEAESRWNLVETAWEVGVSKNLLNVRYDDVGQILYMEESFRRKTVTSARGALNGYQKGKCFYCFADITVLEGLGNSCDVDHCFPHRLKPYMPNVNLDGVWNLVLACPACNRGRGGKFDSAPATKYLERLHKRNEFLISSHHPLRETIIRQTGSTEQERISFLRNVDRIAVNKLIHRWETPQVAPATF